MARTVRPLRLTGARTPRRSQTLKVCAGAFLGLEADSVGSLVGGTWRGQPCFAAPAWDCTQFRATLRFGSKHTLCTHSWLSLAKQTARATLQHRGFTGPRHSLLCSPRPHALPEVHALLFVFTCVSLLAGWGRG